MMLIDAVTFGGQTLFSFPAVLRQEGGGACSEKGFSAFYVCSDFAVHFLYKSALTARVDSETVNDYFKFLIN